MMHLEHPKLPRFRFDYDPAQRRLWVVNISKPTHEWVGELIADKIESPDAAQYVTKMWCAGYLAKELEQAIPGAPQHRRIHAEGGVMGLHLGTSPNGAYPR